MKKKNDRAIAETTPETKPTVTPPTGKTAEQQKQLPKNEWEAFFAVYENKPQKGVRLNVLKGDRYALKARLPFLGEAVPWE